MLADPGQGGGEGEHALELATRRGGAPAGVVAVLLATARVAAGRLEVAARIGQIQTSVQAGGTPGPGSGSASPDRRIRVPSGER